MDTKASDASGAEKIWLDPGMYIPVNSKGYCTSFAEGALGCVVEVKLLGRNGHRALKLPRLLADTLRENAYINTLMEHEFTNVSRVFDEGGSPRIGLLTAIPSALGWLKQPVKTENPASEEATAHNGHMVLVRFEKGMPPRFCSVSAQGGKRSIFPKTLPDGAEDWLPTDLIEQCFRDAKAAKKIATLYLRSGQRMDLRNKRSGTLDDTLGEDYSEDVWYAFVPSVLYHWADGSLQEAISTGNIHHPPEGGREPWSVQKYLELSLRVLQGVNSLHSRGLLHADLRPANVMHEGDAYSPENYSLIDYGSFGTEGTIQPTSDPSEHRQTGNTLLGPSITAQRATPFYAPERRAGSEHETADTAIILAVDDRGRQEPRQSADGYLVQLGWKSELLSGNDPKPEVLAAMLEALKGGALDASGTEGLGQGDRIRLRDFIFEITKVLSSNILKAAVPALGVAGADENPTHRRGGLLVLCKMPAWKVYHDRLVVPDLSMKELREQKALPVPRVVELRHLSAATDLYAFGAMLLYALFARGDAKESVEGREIDRLFADMMSTVESPVYFNQICEGLEKRCQELHNFAGSGSVADKERLAADCGEEVKLILYTTPGMPRVLASCDDNVAVFLLVLRFVLRCLHRGSGSGGVPPFCQDRHVPPTPGGPAKRALEELKHLEDLVRSYVKQPMKKTHLGDLGPESNRDAVKVRFEIQRLSGALKKSREQVAMIKAIAPTILDRRLVRFMCGPDAIRNLSEAIDRADVI